jgi:pimeloyl-ACP methyl ester carboxylesterase
MSTIDIPVSGGALRALRFGDGPRLALAAHGITASGMSFRTVARHLPPDWSLVAVDLRGRGGSADLPGPYGMAAHAADLCLAAEWLGAGPVALTGQSMGAYAAVVAAANRPDLFTQLLLIDGGLPLPVPADADPDEVLRMTLGPALARLTETYASVDDYLAFFRAHPALTNDWNPDMAEYVRYDALELGGSVRSRTSGEAVAADGRDLLVNARAYGAALAGLELPTHLLYAPRGMFGQSPGVLPQPVVDAALATAPRLVAEMVEDCNHYTILMTDPPAKIIAERLTQV